MLKKFTKKLKSLAIWQFVHHFFLPTTTQAAASNVTAPKIIKIPFVMWALPGSSGQLVAESLAKIFSQELIEINTENDNYLHINQTQKIKPWGNKQTTEQMIKTLLINHPILLCEVSDKKIANVIAALAKITTNAGYRHIFLYRRDTCYRLLLKHHARNQKIMHQNNSKMMPLDFDALQKSNEQEITNLLTVSHLVPDKKRLTIAIEDLLLQDKQRARPKGMHLLNFLGLGTIPAPQRLKLLMRMVHHYSEPQFADFSCYPGFADFQQDSRLIPGFAEGRVMVKRRVESYAALNNLPLFRPSLSRIPPIVREGATLQFGGIAMPPEGFTTDADTMLRVTQGNQDRKVAWGLPSPQVLRFFPNHPCAISARYAEIEIRAHTNVPAFISLCNSQGQEAKLASIHFDNNGRTMIKGIFIQGVRDCQSREYSIGYLPIPKNASTSLYNGLYKLITGHYYQGEEKNSWAVHQYFINKRADISGATFRFAVVRDPVKRFLSGYVNRVLMAKQLTRAKIVTLAIAQQFDLDNFPYNPNLSDFICNFDWYYQKIPTIFHHFRPQHEWIVNREQFDRIYPIENLDQLVDDIKMHCGMVLELRREMKSNINLTVADLTTDEFNKIVNFYDGDYKMLADLYSPVA